MSNAFPINFTDAAANKVKLLVTEKVNEDDLAIEKNGVSLVVDPMSLQYLVGGTIDYVEGLQGSRFVVDNPNATTTCGCGSSFSV